MILIIKLIFLTSIWVLGIKISTANDMVLEKLSIYGQKKIESGHKIVEALIICEWCMPSIHSLIGYLFAIGIGFISEFSWSLVVIYPIIVMGSSLTCGIIWNAYMLMNSKKEYYDNAQKYYYLNNKKLKDNKN